MDCRQRPNRSDLHLSKEEEARIEEETRHHFDELAPKRHSKPQRSEYSDAYVDTNTNTDNIPEDVEFQRLEHDQQQMKLGYNHHNGSQMSEEFVETDYYKDLNYIDKQHHTTGTGFIKMEESTGGDGERSLRDSSMGFDGRPPANIGSSHESRHGNPATNDWVPTAADDDDQEDASVSGLPANL